MSRGLPFNAGRDGLVKVNQIIRRDSSRKSSWSISVISKQSKDTEGIFRGSSFEPDDLGLP